MKHINLRLNRIKNNTFNTIDHETNSNTYAGNSTESFKNTNKIYTSTRRQRLKMKNPLPQLAKQVNQNHSLSHTPNIYFPGEEKVYGEPTGNNSQYFQSPMDNDQNISYENYGNNAEMGNLLLKNLDSFSPVKRGRNSLMNSQK